MKTGTNEKVLEVTEELSQIPDASPTQVTIQKMLNLKTFTPGQYTIRLKVTDKNRNQTVSPAAQFTVT